MERDRRLEIRITSQEHEILEKAVRAGQFKNMSDLLRKRALDPECAERNVRKELRELTYQIRKIGVNINQIAHCMNAGYQTGADESMVLRKLEQVDEHLLEIRQMFEKGG